jgi:hypothetical protein
MGQNHFLKNPKFDAEITIFSDSNPHVPTLKAPSRRIFFFRPAEWLLFSRRPFVLRASPGRPPVKGGSWVPFPWSYCGYWGYNDYPLVMSK